MSLPEDKAWFGPKNYGYGWGWPTRWQGWLVLALYVAALCAPAPFVDEPGSTMAYFVYAAFLTLGVIAIYVWKGVKPRWRWGGDSDEDKNI